MEVKDFVMAVLALLAVLASAFISIRSDIRDLTVKVSTVNARVDSIHETCCGEIRK